MTAANRIDAAAILPKVYGGARTKLSTVVVIPMGQVKFIIVEMPTKRMDGVKTSLKMLIVEVRKVWVLEIVVVGPRPMSWLK